MVKKIIYLIYISLFNANVFLPAMQQDPTSENLSVITSDVDLQNFLTKSQEEKDLLIKKANSDLYNLIEDAQFQIQGTINLLSNARQKIASSIEEIQTIGATDTFNLIADLVINIKTMGQALITHLSNHLNELYIPIAVSPIISDTSIKNQMKTMLELINDFTDQLRKTFPSTISRSPIQQIKSVPVVLQQQAPAQKKTEPAAKTEPLKPSYAEATTIIQKKGVEGLYQFITSHTVRGLSNEDKEKIITQIKRNYQEMQEYDDSLNKAASITLTQLNSLKNMNKESADSMKKIFTIQQDPEYETAPLIVKYDTLSRGYIAITETVKMLNENISKADAGIIKFISELFGPSSTDEKFLELKNLEAKQAELMETINELLDKGKKAIETSQKLFI